MTNIGIIGVRSRNDESDFKKVHKEFRSIVQDTCMTFEDALNHVTIVSGGARQGGDYFAMLLADFYKIPEERRIIHRPKPDQYGYPKCYFIRNDLIVRDSHMLIAAQDPKQKQNKGGTNYTINRFKKLKSSKDLFIV